MHFIEASARSFQGMTKRSQKRRAKINKTQGEALKKKVKSIQQLFQNLFFVLFFKEKDSGLRIGLFQRSFETNRNISNVNETGEVEIVKDEKRKCKPDNEIYKLLICKYSNIQKMYRINLFFLLYFVIHVQIFLPYYL